MARDAELAAALVGTHYAGAPRRARACASWRATTCVPWRSLLVGAVTLVALVAQSFVEAPYVVSPWLWLALFGSAAVCLTHVAWRIVVDIFDDGASEGRGLPGIVRYADVWFARELAMASVVFLFFLFPRGDYGRFFSGLEVYDAVAPLAGGPGASVWVVWPHVFSYWTFNVLSTGAEHMFPVHPFVRVVITFVSVISFLATNTVLVIGFVEALSEVKKRVLPAH